jgi:hypothetical protein
MAALFVVCGILAGVAVYRYGEARATWRRVKDGKAADTDSVRTERLRGGTPAAPLCASSERYSSLLFVLNVFK